MKKIIITLFLALFISMTAFAANSASLNISGTVPSYEIGDRISMTVDLSEYSTACGGSFEVIYDASKLALVSHSKGMAFSNINATINAKYRENSIKIVWFGTVNPAGGAVLNLEFEAIDNGEAEVEISNVKMSDLNADIIECTTTDAQFRIYDLLEMYDLSENGTVTVYSSYESKNAVMVFVSYDKDGRIFDVSMKNVSLVKGENPVTPLDFVSDGCSEVSAMLINNLTQFVPICESVQLLI